MTVQNYEQELRCGQPLLAQQWGLKFDAADVVGLTKAVEQAIGKTLAGVGMVCSNVHLNGLAKLFHVFTHHPNVVLRLPSQTVHCRRIPVAA